ncbi:MAG: aminodeoxychorismate synthase component I [Bacteroidota bacterium]
MKVTPIDKFVRLMNEYSVRGVPYLFIIDFNIKTPEIYKLDDIPPGIRFTTPLLSNSTPLQSFTRSFLFEKYPVPFSHYNKAFKFIQNTISMGRTFLANLTFPTRIKTDLTLEDIFNISSAKYKLLYHNKFIVFSPETFIRINDHIISSFPMKGTIDASIPGSEHLILSDMKETAEHNTIVDLIRNDLSIVADNVTITRYRFIDRIKTSGKTLLQVSSEITGYLEKNYRNRLGNILLSMLPAGSVTGAPKKETIRIIKESEEYDRGWYTGVFGVYDGRNLDSAVIIRYIENDSGTMYYKSGGGITFMSNAESEFKELIDKVYVPVG